LYTVFNQSINLSIIAFNSG